MQYVLIYGNLADGHTFVGPFEDYDAAQRYMSVEPSTVDIHIMELAAPASDEAEPPAMPRWLWAAPVKPVSECSIDELELSVRSYRCLLNCGIRTLGALVQYSRRDLMSIPNLGARSLRDIEEALEPTRLRLSKIDMGPPEYNPLKYNPSSEWQEEKVPHG